jgi:hypothetical protein
VKVGNSERENDFCCCCCWENGKNKNNGFISTLSCFRKCYWVKYIRKQKKNDLSKSRFLATIETKICTFFTFQNIITMLRLCTVCVCLSIWPGHWDYACLSVQLITSH